GIRGTGSDERRDRTGFGDALFQNLAVFGFLVIKERVHVDGLVELADTGINSDLAEERLHSERTRFVRDNRNDELSDLRIAQQFCQHADEDHRGRNFAALGALVELLKDRFRNRLDRLGADLALRHVAAKLFAASLHVLDLRAVVRGTIERRVVQLVVGNWNSEARAEHPQLVFVQLLLLVGDVLAFASLAKTVAFDRLCEDERRSSRVLDRSLVGRVNFDGIVSAETHARELLVGKMLNHAQQPRIRSEHVLPEVGTTLNEELLILAVSDFAQTPHQQAVAIVLDEAVPIAAPDNLDYIPSGAAENSFEFLNDFAIAANGTVEALQVAVDHPDQVIEPLARSERDGSQ